MTTKEDAFTVKTLNLLRYTDSNDLNKIFGIMTVLQENVIKQKLNCNKLLLSLDKFLTYIEDYRMLNNIDTRNLFKYVCSESRDGRLINIYKMSSILRK